MNDFVDLHIRLTPEQMDMLEDYAGEADMTVEEYVIYACELEPDSDYIELAPFVPRPVAEAEEDNAPDYAEDDRMREQYLYRQYLAMQEDGE